MDAGIMVYKAGCRNVPFLRDQAQQSDDVPFVESWCMLDFGDIPVERGRLVA